MRFSKEDLLLYAVTDRHWLNGARLEDHVQQALEAGVTCVQLREKDLDEESFEKEARILKDLCARYDVPFLIDDNVALAKKVGADGVHVGQSDMEAGHVRDILGPDKILGVSVQTVQQALLAQERGADYLGVGAVFPTGSKADATEVTHETLAEICAAVDIPVVAIGGISSENVEQLKGSNIAGIAVISAIFAAPDISVATRELREKIS